MSAGNLFGTILIGIFLGAVWTILGFVIDKVTTIANITFHMMPVYEDGVLGFNMISTFYGFLLIIIWFGLALNYVMNENSQANQEV